MSPVASMIATHMNVPYGKILEPEDIVATLKSGDFVAATKDGNNLLVSLFVEVEPELIIRCAYEIQAPLENVNRLYQKTLEVGFFRSPAWEEAIAALL